MVLKSGVCAGWGVSPCTDKGGALPFLNWTVLVSLRQSQIQSINLIQKIIFNVLIYYGHFRHTVYSLTSHEH